MIEWSFSKLRVIIIILPSFIPTRYYCTSPDIDINSQTAIGCRSNGTVLVTCHAAPNVTCSNITEYDSDEVVFCREEKCRYV